MPGRLRKAIDMRKVRLCDHVQDTDEPDLIAVMKAPLGHVYFGEEGAKLTRPLQALRLIYRYLEKGCPAVVLKDFIRMVLRTEGEWEGLAGLESLRSVALGEIRELKAKANRLESSAELFAAVLEVLGLRYGEDKVWAEDPDSLAESVGLAAYLNEKLESQTARSEIGQLPSAQLPPGAELLPRNKHGEYAPIEVLAKENAELREQLAAVDGRHSMLVQKLDALQRLYPQADSHWLAVNEAIVEIGLRRHQAEFAPKTAAEAAALQEVAVAGFGDLIEQKLSAVVSELEKMDAAELSNEPTRVVLFPGLASWLKAYEAELRNDLAGDVGVLAGGLITVPLRRLHDGYLGSFETPPKGSIAELSCFRQAVQMAGYVTKPGAHGAEVVFGEKADCQRGQEG